VIFNPVLSSQCIISYMAVLFYCVLVFFADSVTWSWWWFLIALLFSEEEGRRVYKYTTNKSLEGQEAN